MNSAGKSRQERVKIQFLYADKKRKRKNNKKYNTLRGESGKRNNKVAQIVL